MNEKTIIIKSRSSNRLVASVEVASGEDAQEVKRGIEKVFSRLLGCEEYRVLVQERQEGEER